MKTKKDNDLRAQFLRQAQRYCDKEKISLPTLGRRVLKDTAFFARVENGGGFTVRTYDRFQDYFAGREEL